MALLIIAACLVTVFALPHLGLPQPGNMIVAVVLIIVSWIVALGLVH